MSESKHSKWVACWGNATSITDRKECVYAKNLTLRYPVRMVFDGSAIRLRFSNLTGTETVCIDRVLICLKRGKEYRYSPVALSFSGSPKLVMEAGAEVQSDELPVDIKAGDMLDVSMYLGQYTQMNAGTLVTGPLSKGQYAYGDFAECEELPLDLSRRTNWFYFLNTIDVLTEEKNHALVCFGDSITAQSWPDYLAIRAWESGQRDVAVIRRAVSGTRILRQYDCITYQAYGLKGETRFPVEMNVAGASAVIIQHGINDIIHPVGVDVNPFRPWSDLPSCSDLIDGVRQFYLPLARKMGIKVCSGTLLPIFGWRTYSAEKDRIRREFNLYLRKSPDFDMCIDFDNAVRDQNNPASFATGYDSGDHLHPSEDAYKAMAECVPQELFKLQ